MPAKNNAFPSHIRAGILLVFAWLAGLIISRYRLPFFLHPLALIGLLAPFYIWSRATPLPVPALPNRRNTPLAPSVPPTPLFFDSHQGAPYSQPQTNEALAASFSLQLKLLCHNLHLTSALLVTADQEGETLAVRASYSTKELEFAHSFSADSGIFISLRQGRQELAGQPSSPLFRGLPYYPQGQAVGSFFALTLDKICPTCPTSYLCVDRDLADSWPEKVKELLRAAGRKISYDIFLAIQLADFDRDKKATTQICLALQELNGVLGLEEAFLATERAVRDLTGADFVAVTLKDQTEHAVVLAKGPGANGLVGSLVSEEACLVNQAMKMQRPMPPLPEYNGPAPIFSQERPMAGFRSLLILPLLIKEEEPMGSLIVAGVSPGLFSQESRDILDLIGAHIATKIDQGRAHEKVYQLATTDGLTSLANHRTFQDALIQMAARAQRLGTKFALLLCDIDHFKMVNDTYGHPFGDEVLREVARVLRESVRSIDLAARYGGEEFTLLLENTDQKGALLLAERIRAQMAGLKLICGTARVSLTMSLGIAIYPNHSNDPAELIAKADQALYAAKE
ncbi:MAG: sensor domain-containing diguanylate cyclase, partial [Desulfurivibrionaceae bacterium]|nr:sensor domain-containing diguanylate cyclase [Desulfurivibrionaceae bacterium]